MIGPTDRTHGLPPAARRLWLALLRERARQKLAAEDYFIGDLRTLAGRAHIASYSTVKWALAILRRARLVCTSRTYVRRVVWHVDLRAGLRGATEVNAKHRNAYAVAEAPYETIPGLEDAPLTWAKISGFLKDSLSFDQVYCPSYQREDKKNLIVNLKKRVFRPNFSFLLGIRTKVYTRPEPGRLMIGNHESRLTMTTAREDNLDRLRLLRLTRSHLRQDLGPGGPRYELTSEPRFLQPDDFIVPEDPVSRIPPNLSATQRAVLVIEAYARACKQVYGKHWYGFHRELRKLQVDDDEGAALRAHRMFKPLAASGAAFSDADSPPDHYAIWRLRWFRANVKAFGSKPPPILIVMSAKSVSKLSGWFRKDYVLPVATQEPDSVRREQILRNEESSRIWTCHENPLVMMPVWYCELRAREIAAGDTHPHDRWPRRPS